MHEFLPRLLEWIARGRLTAWAILAVGLIVVGGLSAASAGKSNDVPVNDLASSTESARFTAAAKSVSNSNLAPAVVVFSGSKEDMSAAAPQLAELAPSLIAKYSQAPAAKGDAPRGPPPLITSKDGEAALTFIPMRTDVDTTDRVKELRAALEDLPPGVSAEVTGAPAIAADVSAVFEGADVTLLLGTGLLVLLLLVFIYRSPIFWFVPLSVVVLAEGSVRGIEALLTDAGMTIDPSTAGITSVLVFGAGTDYALLLVARYRDELRREADRFVAMRSALRTAGPTIVASGVSVAVCLLGLTFAITPSLRTLGVLSSIGVLVAMTAMLTLLPAALLVTGRWIFWPFIPKVDEAAPQAGTSGWWRRTGERVARRPRIVWITVAIVLVLCGGWITTLPNTLSPSEQFRDKVDAIEGQKTLAAHFPSGSGSANQLFVPGADAAEAAAIASKLSATGGAIESANVSASSSAGSIIDLIGNEDPYSETAIDQTPELRAVAHRVAPGSLLGGPTAQNYDEQKTAQRDVRVVVPIVLVAEAVLLALLLQALVAPAILLMSVVLSFAAALGIGALAFSEIFNFTGAAPSLPLLAFVFLTALGVDYNIFLMARAREETDVHGNKEGILRALGATGSVITSAGIVLAGTFAILGALPVVQLAQLGFIIAVGVIVDTFIVRSLLVPAAVLDADWRTWAPSKLARKLRERDDL